jgi:hypothetical protein
MRRRSSGAERLVKRVRLAHSFRRLTLRSATGTAQRARPYRHENPTASLHTLSGIV